MEVPIGTTVNRQIMNTQREIPEATGDFTALLTELIVAAKIISREVNKAGLADILGLSGKTNIQGEEVQKLDDLANETIKRRMASCGYVCVMASEEEEKIVHAMEGFEGKYVIAFDPLDGSSNIDVNVNIGSIFSIYRKKSPGKKGTLEDMLQAGRNQVGAGYIVYGSSTMLVYTAGQGVHGFTLDPSVGEFFLSHPDIKIPTKGKIYSVNEGNYNYWSNGTKKYIDHIKSDDKGSGHPYSTRYIGSLVADFHRNLLRGGIFLYPMDYKDPAKPRGKLRLLYEANPLALIVEEAGGRASDGTQDILDIEPKSLHQRVPLIIGSKDDVDMAEKFITESE
jgi:fructose-1,6-bisphosphatase I